jgi:hypothetical protein
MGATYNLNGNLTVSTGGMLEDNGFTFNGGAGSTFTLSSGAELRVKGSNSFPVGFGTYTMETGSHVRYQSTSAQVVASLAGQAYGDLTVEQSGTRTLAGDIVVNGDLTILTGAVLDANNHNIRLRGNWRRNPNSNSAFVAGTGSIIFDGGVTQLINMINSGSDSESFYHVAVENNSTLALDPEAETNQTTQLDILGNLTITNGSLDLRNRALTLSGNLVNNSGSSTAISAASNITFNNTGADQAISGNSGLLLQNVTLAKAAGTSLLVDTLLSISGTLNWSNDGNIRLANDALTFGAAASVSGEFGINRMIESPGTAAGPLVIKEGNATANSYDFTFPVGVSGNYTPVIIDAVSLTGSGSIGVRSVSGNSSSAFTLQDAGRAINRYFTVSLDGISSMDAAVSFTYADADVQANEAAYLSWVYEGTSITAEATNGFVHPLTNTFGSTAVNISTASTEWLAAEPAALFPRLYSVVASGDWANASSWNTTADGSGSAMLPTQYHELEIQGGDTISVSSASSLASLQLDGQLIIDGSAASYDLGVFTGTGRLVFNSGDLAAYDATGTTFFDNGTVEFTGASDYSLPASLTEYHNLEISGSGTKTMGTNILIHNDLEIDAATLDADATENYNLSLGGSLNLLNSGTFLPRNGEFALIGSGDQIIPAGITFNNLRFDNLGTKTINTSGAFTINNFRILPTSGAINFSVPTNLQISGNWENASGAGVYSNLSTIDFTGAADQNISGTNTFHQLAVNKSAGTLNATGTITLNDGSGGGNLTVSSGSTVAGTADYNLLGDLTNSGIFSTSGTLTFNGVSAQNISGSNSLGSLVINNATGVTIADGVSTTIASDLTITPGSLNTGAGTIVFDGSGAQRINGSVVFNNLTKLAGDALTLSGSSTVNGTLTLTGGNINTSSADMLVMGPDGAVSGGSGSSYVNGPLRHTENATDAGTKVFPFGSGTTYRPITLELTQADAVERSYTGSLTEGTAPSRTLPVGELVRVSGIRYYTISQSPAASVTSASVSIPYHADDLVDEGATLRIAKSDGLGNWINIGGTGSAPEPPTPGIYAAGTITSDAFTSFSDFILASSAEENNPLPIELLSFDATVLAATVQLRWTTAQEWNNEMFIVERSGDGQQFERIGTVQGAGTSTEMISYGFEDPYPIPGTAYYRLKQLDYDGSYSYSKIVSASFSAITGHMAALSPNPAVGGRTVLSIGGAKPHSEIFLSVWQSSGQRVQEMKLEVNEQGYLKRELHEFTRLSPGIYLLLIQSDTFTQTLRLVIR